MTNKRRDGDRSQPQQEEEKHRGNELAGRRWRVGKLFPDEDSPYGRNHGCALADGVRYRRPDDLRMRGDEVEDRAGTPDRTTDDSPHMPGPPRVKILRHADRRGSGERLAHQ